MIYGFDKAMGASVHVCYGPPLGERLAPPVAWAAPGRAPGAARGAARRVVAAPPPAGGGWRSGAPRRAAVGRGTGTGVET